MSEQQGEQTTEQPTQGDPSRDELIAAVRAAGGTDSVDVDAEERAAAERAATAGEQQATDGAQNGEQPGEEEPRIAAILRAREKAHAEQEAARNHAQEMIRQAQEESERLLQEARERADREWRAELERRRQAFQASPTEQLRALGDPQQIVDTVLKENTPEARALAQMQRELSEAKQKASVADDVKKQFDEFRAEQQRQAQLAEVERVRSVFLGQHATQEKAPHLNARYSEEEIFERANKIALDWRKGGLQLVQHGSRKGENDFDYDDVVNYLEIDSKKRLAPLLGSSPAQQASAGAPAKAPGIAPKVPANGTRTLSAAQGSERRTSPKPLSEMSPEEQRAALIEEVAAARRSNPDSVF